MIYLYSMENCPNCEKKKKEFIEKNIKFEERDASRIKAPEDSIDQEALVQASCQNMQLPVVITTSEIEPLINTVAATVTDDFEVKLIDINDRLNELANDKAANEITESVHLKFTHNKDDYFKEKK